MLKRKQQGVGSDDGAATTKYTFLGKEYGHGKETNCPSYYVCHIIDLYNDSYNDNKGLYPSINKKEKADKKGPIPDEFGEYNGVVYKSDRPEPPDYKGRGGLGYGPDRPRKIENTYGP